VAVAAHAHVGKSAVAGQRLVASLGCDAQPEDPRSHHSLYSYAKFFSRSHGAVIRVYDDAGNVIGAHEQAGDFKQW